MVESEETDGVPPPLTMEPDETCVAVRTRPQVPPKPPIDTLRYSMNNIKGRVHRFEGAKTDDDGWRRDPAPVRVFWLGQLPCTCLVFFS
ncbi:unnamed protein product [Caenorhabditis auriculariae]|uniref:Uncharacterized protein n=1 Tax=Caenorhabditis auriculariae TaxID=2777116 RepID=A0A8S1HTK5_9PELO|nr:unnamed protein product [Caenorhabditis auriculariae]